MVFIGATQDIGIPHERPSLLCDHTNVIMRVVYCSVTVRVRVRFRIGVSLRISVRIITQASLPCRLLVAGAMSVSF